MRNKLIKLTAFFAFLTMAANVYAMEKQPPLLALAFAEILPVFLTQEKVAAVNQAYQMCAEDPKVKALNEEKAREFASLQTWIDEKRHIQDEVLELKESIKGTNETLETLKDMEVTNATELTKAGVFCSIKIPLLDTAWGRALLRKGAYVAPIGGSTVTVGVGSMCLTRGCSKFVVSCLLDGFGPSLCWLPISVSLATTVSTTALCWVGAYSISGFENADKERAKIAKQKKECSEGLEKSEQDLTEHEELLVKRRVELVAKMVENFACVLNEQADALEEELNEANPKATKMVRALVCIAESLQGIANGRCVQDQEPIQQTVVQELVQDTEVNAAEGLRRRKPMMLTKQRTDNSNNE